MSHDVIVVGSGPGGYVAAIRAAQLGLRTAVVERDDVVGGRCPTVACIPAKVVLRSAEVLGDVRAASEYGIAVSEPTVDWAAVSHRRRKITKTLTGGVAALLKKHGVDVVRGEGALTSSGDVAVGDAVLTAERGVILATGSVRRPLPGLDYGGNVIGTEEAWALPEIPRSLIVIGAGASGSEIASAYARLGSATTLYEGLDRVLPSEDPDISQVVARAFKKQGITVRTGTLYEGEEAEWVVIAAGRAPDVAPLALDTASVKIGDDGLIAVDATMRTSNARVWAIGDLVPGPALAHKASDEGVVAAEAIAGLPTHRISYEDVPRATFCSPTVASFGLTEEQARRAGHDVVVGKVPYGAVGGGTVHGDRTGMVKIVGDGAYGELLGGHIVGAKAPEMIQELVNVKALEGGYQEVARTIHGHPTISEAVMEAARAADGWLIHG